MRIFSTLMAAALVLIAAAGALAGDNKKEALKAFDEGKALFNAGKYSEAADAFRRANELNPNWKLHYNIGQSEAAAKRHGLALQAFEAYLSQGGDDVSQERRTELGEELKRLRNIVGFIEVTAPAGAVIWVDEVKRGEAPMHGQLPVAASVEHTVVAVVEGEAMPPQRVNVIGGQTATVEFKEAEQETVEEVVQITPPVQPEAEPEPVTEPAEQPEPEKEAEPEPEKSAGTSGEVKDNSGPLRVWGWVTFSFGGVLLLGSAVPGTMALVADISIRANCEDGNCPPPYHKDLDKRDSLALTADIMLGFGTAACVGGIVMLIVAKRKREKNSNVALTPLLGRDTVGASVGWRF